MKAPENRVFSIAEENKPVPGCTISELVSKDNGVFATCYVIEKLGNDSFAKAARVFACAVQVLWSRDHRKRCVNNSVSAQR